MAAFLTFGLCAPQLLPGLAFLPETSRGGGGPVVCRGDVLVAPPAAPTGAPPAPAFSPIGAPGRAEHLFGSVPGRLLWVEALGGSALVSALALAALATRARRSGASAVALCVAL